MERIILGSYSKPPRNMQSLGFVKVLGEVTENELCIEDDYTMKYPSEGEVAFLNPPFDLELYSLGFYKVSYNEGVDKSKQVFSEYRVVSKEWIQPIEFLFIHKITSTLNVRNLLLNGIYLPFLPSNNPCIVLDNGVVIKTPPLYPIEENRRIYKVKSGALKEPLECWESIEVFNTVKVKFEAYNRTLSSSFYWPECKNYFDCASDSEIVSFTFNKLHEIFKEDINITKAQRREIINKLSAIENEIIGDRVQKTLEILKANEKEETKFEDSLKDILNTWPVNSEKAIAINEAINSAVQRLETEKSDLYTNITLLKTQRDLLINDITQLERNKEEILKENISNTLQGEQIIKKIEEQVNLASSNAAGLISNIKLIKPFLNNESNTKYSGISFFCPEPVPTNQAETHYSDYNQLIDIMAFNLKKLGLTTNSAKKVTKYILAIKMANLFPLIINSDAREFSLYISAALSGKTPLIIPPDPKFQSSIEFREAINKNLTDGQTNLILIEDICLFSFETCLLPLLKDYRYYHSFMFNDGKEKDKNVFNNFIVLSSDSNQHFFSLSTSLLDCISPIDFNSWITGHGDASISDIKYGSTTIENLKQWACATDNTYNLNDLFDNMDSRGIHISFSMKKNVNKLLNYLIFLGINEKEAIELILINYFAVTSKYLGWKDQLIDLVSTENLIEDTRLFEKVIK